MDFKDITNEIADVGQKYHFRSQPPFLDELLRWLAKTLHAISHFLNSLLHHGSAPLDSRAMSGLLQMLVYIVCCISVVLLCWVALTKLRSNQRQERERVRGADKVEKLLDAAGWKTEAQRLATTHDYKGACRSLYLSSLQSMHEQQLVPFAPAKTNYEYYALLSRHPGVQKDFRQLAELVEIVWFGNQAADQADYQASLSYLSQLDAQIAQSIQKHADKGTTSN